jgi:hypothetical protein
LRGGGIGEIGRSLLSFERTTVYYYIILQARYENVVSSSDKLLKRLVSAHEEMLKFRGEVSAFRSWLEKAFKILEDKEKQLASLNKVFSFSSIYMLFLYRYRTN